MTTNFSTATVEDILNDDAIPGTGPLFFGSNKPGGISVHFTDGSFVLVTPSPDGAYSGALWEVSGYTSETAHANGSPDRKVNSHDYSVDVAWAYLRSFLRKLTAREGVVVG
jgi:hypothetical protein